MAIIKTSTLIFTRKEEKTKEKQHRAKKQQLNSNSHRDYRSLEICAHRFFRIGRSLKKEKSVSIKKCHLKRELQLTERLRMVDGSVGYHIRLGIRILGPVAELPPPSSISNGILWAARLSS